MKNRGIASYLNILAALLGIVGVACTVVSSNMSTDNALSNLSTLVIAGIVGVVLVAVAFVMPGRAGNHDPISAVAVLGAIALYSFTFGSAAIQRVLLIAGLFSYNAGYTVGWNIFYVSVVGWACLLVGIVLLIAGSFMKSVKE